MTLPEINRGSKRSAAANALAPHGACISSHRVLFVVPLELYFESALFNVAPGPEEDSSGDQDRDSHVEQCCDLQIGGTHIDVALAVWCGKSQYDSQDDQRSEKPLPGTCDGKLHSTSLDHSYRTNISYKDYCYYVK